MYIIYKKALWNNPAHASLDGSAACGAPVKWCGNFTLQIFSPAEQVSQDEIRLTFSTCNFFPYKLLHIRLFQWVLCRSFSCKLFTLPLKKQTLLNMFNCVDIFEELCGCGSYCSSHFLPAEVVSHHSVMQKGNVQKTPETKNPQNRPNSSAFNANWRNAWASLYLLTNLVCNHTANI